MFRKLTLALTVLMALSAMNLHAQNKKRIGVLPFKNKGGKEKNMWLSEGFATTLTEGLQQIQSIYVVDRNQINSVIKKGNFSNDDLFTSKGAYEIGNKLGLDYVIIGAFNIAKDTINTFAIVVDAKKKGEYIKACSPNVEKPMALLWQVYDEMINAVCKSECFNVTITANEKKQIKAITSNTENVSAYEYYIKGRREHLKYSVKGYEDAINWYDKALQLDANYALALGAKGEAQAFWGYQKELNGEPYQFMYDDAYKNVQKGLGISPSIGSIHRNMATTYQMLRRFDDAKAEAQKAVDLNANDAEGWYQLWRAKYGGKVTDPEIQKAIEISPFLPVANLTIGNEYFNEKNYEKAEEYYKRALIGNEEYELAHANLGNMYSTIKRYDEGIASFKRAIELKPHYEFAWNGLGFIYEMQAEELIAAGNTEGGRAKYSEALAAYTKASEINPNKAETFYSIGLMQWRLENWQGVVTAWEKCLKLNPNHQSANEWLPKAKEKLQGR